MSGAITKVDAKARRRKGRIRSASQGMADNVSNSARSSRRDPPTVGIVKIGALLAGIDEQVCDGAGAPRADGLASVLDDRRACPIETLRRIVRTELPHE